MNSCFYECQVMHARFTPRPHRFRYRLFYFAIDLDELETLPRSLGLFSVNGRNLYSFRDRDYLPIDETLHQGDRILLPPPERDGSAPRLKARVLTLAASHGVNLTGGRVVLVTLPRTAGFLFNPVSFYFCYDRNGAPAAAIAEVTNTFREVKPYFIRPETTPHASGKFHLRVPKHFYVSPYSEVDLAFDFTLHLPGARLAVQIDDYDGSTRTLTSTLTGARRPLSPGRLLWFTVKYPFLSLRILMLIHWQALRLWAKRVPWFPKSARPADQRALHRPHHSLQPSDAA